MKVLYGCTQRTERSAAMLDDFQHDIADISSRASAGLCETSKTELAQFYTTSPTAIFMATMFSSTQSPVRILDPGAGTGILTATYIHRILTGNEKPPSIEAWFYEIDESVYSALKQTIELCEKACASQGIQFNAVVKRDFIDDMFNCHNSGLFAEETSKPTFNRIILNPPYKKIRSDSVDYKKLKKIGAHSNNLYSAFVSLCVNTLEENGELVAITPRSFCNGTYFRNFRQDILSKSAINHIHVFESRKEAFKEDKVLQENIIFKLSASLQQKSVTISSTHGRNFDEIKVRKAPINQVLNESDDSKIIHIISSDEQAQVAQKFEKFKNTLNDIHLAVSTGPLVDFRHKPNLAQEMQAGYVPLIYAAHFDGLYINLDKAVRANKKIAVQVTSDTEKWLVPNKRYLLTKRFSSKEERRRLVASILEPDSKHGALIGIENHLNFYRDTKQEQMSKQLALGLYAFLNSTLVDDYFRLFSGHTQVNSTDLRYLKYPSREALERIGNELAGKELKQQVIDDVIDGLN